MKVTAPSGTTATGGFTIKPTGSAGFVVRIVETGTFTVNLTAPDLNPVGSLPHGL